MSEFSAAHVCAPIQRLLYIEIPITGISVASTVADK